MKTAVLRFHCVKCHARIKAPVQLSGQRRHCPRCQRAFTVPRLVAQAGGPVMVLVEEKDRFVLALAGGAGAAPKRSA